MKKNNEINLIKNKAKYLLNDFLKIGKNAWDLGISIVQFSVQVITFWEFLINTNIAKNVGLFLSGLKFR